MEIPVGAYREVFLDQAVPGHWKEITVDTGTTQSTLQDIKATELAGCYSYEQSDHPATRNRFIYWRTSQDCLELIELSFDSELIGNQLRYRFTNAPLLSGLTVHETQEHIVVLVVTVSSVHRLTFKHPATNRSQNPHGGSAQSAFLYASATAAKDPNCFHVINRPHNAAMPTCGASWLSADGDVAAFALSGTTDVVTLVQLFPGGQHQEGVLNEHATVMPKFFSSLAQVIRGKRETVSTADLVLLNCDDCTVLICLGADGNLRHAVAESPSGSMRVHELASEPGGGRGAGPGLQPHLVRACAGPDGEPLLVVHLCFADVAAFHVLQPLLAEDADALRFESYAEVSATEFMSAQMDLVDVCIADGRLVGAWRGPDGASFVASTALCAEGGWTAAQAEDVSTMPEEQLDPQGLLPDPQLAYSEHIFAPGRFTIPVITRALNVFQRGTPVPAAMSRGTLLRAASLAVDAEVCRAEAADEEEAVECAHAAWAALRSCVLQWHLAGDGPAAIAPAPPDVGGLLLVKKHRVSLLRRMEPLEASTPRDSLANVVRDLAAMVPADGWQTFDRHPAETAVSPFSVACRIAEQLHEADDDSERVESLSERVSRLRDWPKPAAELLSLLVPEPAEPGNAAALSSPVGAAVVATALQQTIDNRLQLCRGLLVLTCVLRTEMSAQATILERHITALEQMEQAFSALHWACGRTAGRGAVNVAQLLATRLSDRDRRGTDLAARVRHMLCMLWPLGGAARLGELLLAADEVVTLIGLEERMRPWCNEHVGLRSAQLGRACLRLGQPHRAVDYFVRAADNVAYEPEILKVVDCAATTPEKALGMYYIKVMDALDRGEYREQTGDVALAALTKLPVDDAMLPTLHSRLFARAMALRRYADAFAAVRANPDAGRRLDALRELAVTLVRTGQTNALLAFEFNDLLPALERVLERSARAAYPSLRAGYGALYSLHLRRGDRRKAAGYMYEMVFRLGREVPPTLRSLRTQLNCLLICISAMRLVADKFRWIASQEYKEEDVDGEKSPRTETKVAGALLVDTELEEELAAKPFLVTILQMADLERQLEMLRARIQLCHARPNEYGEHFLDKKWSPTEMVAVLSACRLFCDALRLAALFNVALARPLECLASANVELQRQPESDAWDWLQNNYTPETGDCEMTASNTAWRLLEVLLLRYERPGQTTLHKAVLSRFIHESFHPPHFMVRYYRRHNPAELLRLYLHAGWLEDAAHHSQKFVSAMTESFPDFGGSENVTSGRPGCLPWRALQQLLDELDRPEYAETRTSLKEEIDRYIWMSKTAVSGVGLAASGFAPPLRTQPVQAISQW